MAAEEDDAAALAALASRGDALFAALRDAHPESCVRASLPVAASSLGDTAAVVRAAAPVALAARRALEALRDAAAAAREDEEEEDARSNSPNPRRPPPVIVELCGPEGGHVVGMLLAATLPAGAASEIVLVDRRWPTKRATTVRSRFEVGSNAPDASDARTTSPAAAAAPFPVAHVDDPALFGGGVPLTRWRAKTTSAGDLRALHASLEATNAAALIVSRRAPGTATLRAAQLFLAPPHTNVEDPPTTSGSTRSRPGSRPAPRALVLEPGDPPDKATALRGKTTYRATRDVLGVVAPPRPTTSTSGSEERRTELRTVSFTARDVFARGRSAEDATRAWRALCARAAGARSVNDERYIYAATSDGDDRAARAARAFDALAARAFDALAALEPVGGVRTDFEPTSNPPRGVSSSDASGGGAFGPVALGAADQMAEIVARVAALVDVTRPRRGERRVRSRFEVSSKNAETTVAIEDASGAAAGKKETRRADDAAEEEEDVFLDIFLRRSDPSRWTSGGYAAHHYVAADPQPHAACFEAEVAGARVGFVAIGAYGGDGAEALIPPEEEDEDEDEEEEAEAGTHASPGGKKERAASDSHLRTPRSTRFLTAAQVDRLCVLPSRRGVGVKEALLRVADAFHALGLPVRLKTASVDATRSLLRCPLLALEGFRDPRTKAGVAKRRGAKIVAVVPRLRSSGIETSSSSRDAPLLLRGEENIDELRRAAAASPGDGRANTRVPTKRGGGPFAAVHAAMNRAAPDTVARSAAAMDAAIDGIVRRGAKEEADGGGADDAKASESGVSDASESGVSDARSLVAATIARRASAEPAFADTHAAIVAGLADTRVAREIVRATRLRVRNALDGRRSKEAAREDPTSDPTSDPSRGAAFDPLAPGAARFLAAMASRGVAGADRGMADAKTLAANALRDDGFPVIRASASSLLPNAAAEAEAPSGARRTPLDPRAVTAERVEPAPVFVAALEIARALAEGGATLADAVPLDVAKALEAMARRSAADVRRGDGEATTERRGASAVPSRRAAFLAERVLVVLEAERRASGAAGSGVPEVPEVLRSSNRAMTRAEVHAAFVAEGAPRSVKSDYPRAEKADAYSRKNGDERDAALVTTSRRVVAVEGSAAAVERGMRRGWVFWYAGSPVVRFPDAKPFVFDAESAAGFHSRERSHDDAGSDDDADPRRSRREDGGKRSPSRGPRRRFVPAPVGATWPTEGAVHRV